VGTAPLRVAFVGKGGAGKSTIAGTVARLLARRGHEVLAVDSDPMPGLALSIGVAPGDDPIPDDAVIDRPEGTEGPRYLLRPDISMDEAIERYTVAAPDGVRFLQFGKLRGTVAPFHRSQHAFRQLLDGLPGDRWSVVGDLPGGTRQPFLGWGDFAETMLVVVEPTAASMLTARRLMRLADRAERPPRVLGVVNKAMDRSDTERVERRTGLTVIAGVPVDADVAEAERRGLAPIDEASRSEALRAVGLLVDRLTEEGPT
jgi:CO dehydrogenase maturation factor